VAVDSTAPQVQVAEHVERPDIAFSSEERTVIADALTKKEDGALHLASSAMTRVTSGQPLSIADAIVIHGALMVARDVRATPIIARLRASIRSGTTEP
jgi:hypothetical protein